MTGALLFIFGVIGINEGNVEGTLIAHAGLTVLSLSIFLLIMDLYFDEKRKDKKEIEAILRKFVGAKYHMSSKPTKDGLSHVYTISVNVTRTVLIDVPFIKAIRYLAQNMGPDDECFHVGSSHLNLNEVRDILALEEAKTPKRVHGLTNQPV